MIPLLCDFSFQTTKQLASTTLRLTIVNAKSWIARDHPMACLFGKISLLMKRGDWWINNRTGKKSRRSASPGHTHTHKDKRGRSRNKHSSAKWGLEFHMALYEYNLIVIRLQQCTSEFQHIRLLFIFFKPSITNRETLMKCDRPFPQHNCQPSTGNSIHTVSSLDCQQPTLRLSLSLLCHPDLQTFMTCDRPFVEQF